MMARARIWGAALVLVSSTAWADGPAPSPAAAVAPSPAPAPAASPAKGAPAARVRGPTARAAGAAAAAVSARYAAALRAWHLASPGQRAPVDGGGRPMLALSSLNTREHVALGALSDDGGFAARDLDRAAAFLREPASGNAHPIEPRVLSVLYRIQRRFDAAELRVLSGYRTPRRGGASNHGRGRAIDFVVPGVANEEVAAFARSVGFVGVGTYPTSGFVHVDVRERSYFWVDSSGPGRRSRERGVLADIAQASDAEARARGERPVARFFVAPDVDAALRVRGVSSLLASPDDDEDDDDGHDGDEAP